jgi:hypothetical protein
MEFSVMHCKNQRPGIFNDQRKIIRANRTECCDAVHEAVVSGKVLLPRRCDEVEVLAKQLTNTAKALEENPETGSREYRYRKLGADHYFHALGYCLLAARRVGVSDEAPGYHQKVRVITDFDPRTYDLHNQVEF